MATLEELVVNLVAETSGLRAELDKAVKTTQGASEKMDKALEEFSNNSSKNMSIFENAFGTAIGFLGSQVVLGAFNAAKDVASALFDELIIKGVESAIEAENALNKFNSALALTGKYSRETSLEFKAFTDDIEHNSNVTAENALEAASLIQSLGNLEKDGLKRATQAAVDMSAALGIDLQSAAKLVGKAATGEVASFSKFGIKLEEGTSKADTFDKALTALSSKFGGSAANQINTYSGQVNQLTNRWGDITEVFGRTVIENTALLEVMKELNKLLVEQTGSLEANEDSFKILAGETLVVFIDALGIATAGLDALIRSFEVALGITKVIALPFDAISATLTGMFVGHEEGQKQWEKDLKQAGDWLGAFGESGDGVLADMTQNFARLSNAASNGLDNMKAGAEQVVEPVTKAGEKVKELTAEQTAYNNALKEFATGLAEQTTSLDSNYQYQLELLQLNKEAQLLTEQEFLDAKFVMLSENEAYEQQLLADSLAKKQITAQQYTDARTALDRKYALENKKIANEQTAYDLAQQKLRADNFKGTMGYIATLANSSSKELAAIGKAAAITQATIDGYAAVQKALASAPPPINFALAAAVGVATAANVAKIAGVGLNDGGKVMGGGANVDSVPAVLTKGETVISRDLTSKLEQFLNQGAQAGQSIVIEVSYKDSALMDFIETKIVERQRTGQSLLQGSV